MIELSIINIVLHALSRILFYKYLLSLTKTNEEYITFKFLTVLVLIRLLEIIKSK